MVNVPPGIQTIPAGLSSACAEETRASTSTMQEILRIRTISDASAYWQQSIGSIAFATILHVVTIAWRRSHKMWWGYFGGDAAGAVEGGGRVWFRHAIRIAYPSPPTGV